MRLIRRVAVVSEHMGGTLDEGIRKFATELMEGFRAHAIVFGISTTGTENATHPLVKHVSGNKLFMGRALRDEIEEINPDLIVYIPSASGTAFSFWRARILKRCAPKAKIAMIAVQQRHHTPLGRLVVSEMTPDKVFAQSRETIRYMEWLGMAAQFLPSGVDLVRFQPVDDPKKAELRGKWSLPADDYLVLHVGHIKPGRNVELLMGCRKVGTPVVVSGKSMGQDAGLRKRLEAAGVILIDTYVRDIEEIYQACDAYLFPVRDEDSAMEFPLSVLEAMACNLPVVAYPYGGLTMALEPGDGLVFVESDEAMVAAIESVRRIPVSTRAKAEPYTWEHVAFRMLELMQGSEDAGPKARAV
ncbi:MAG: glycosyltransferase [Dehalococcoidia bacterium]